MTKEKVEILPACYWICPECGRDNFEYVVTAEFSIEERDMLDEVHEICFELDGGDYVIQPTDVTCQHCGEEFESDRKDENIDGESEDDEDGTYRDTEAD
jgi:rubredoxin